jgi:pyridoxal phosphate enzyme (YggS family)
VRRVPIAIGITLRTQRKREFGFALSVLKTQRSLRLKIMIDIAKNIRFLRQEIPSSVKIVAVSKTRPASDILTAYNAGQRIFGENRVQELLSKKEQLPFDIDWHFIGHLQSNKVKQLVPHAGKIHSVDSFRLLSVIDRESVKYGVVTDCLIQFHIAKEESKFGFSPEEARDMFNSDDYMALKNIRICGVMGMATFTDNHEAVRSEFRFLKNCFDRIKSDYFSTSSDFCEISI